MLTACFTRNHFFLMYIIVPKLSTIYHLMQLSVYTCILHGYVALTVLNIRNKDIHYQTHVYISR